MNQVYFIILIKEAGEGRKEVKMKILVVNCGSSTLKFQLIDSETEEVSASGLCERIGLGGSITYKKEGEKYQEEVPFPDHGVAIQKVLDTLLDGEIGVLKSLSEINAIGHRLVHGVIGCYR